jgi:hypothetical protein
MASNELCLLASVPENYRSWSTAPTARRKKSFARFPTALRPSCPVQQSVFHQAERKLTSLPDLRYSSDQKKRWVKDFIHDARWLQLDLKGKSEPVSAWLIAGAPRAKDWSEPRSLRGLTVPVSIH